MLNKRLKKYSNASCTSATYATPDTIHTLEVARVARVARVQVATADKTNSIAIDEIISNWWLMHFVDREPVEVAIWPPCNKAGAFESYPNSIAAEPLPSPITVEATPYD